MWRRWRGTWRGVLPVLWLVAALPAAQAQEAPAAPLAADRSAIRSVIRDQIEAFRRDDGAGAFADASPGIRHMFGDAASFMEMVRRGYAPVYRPRRFAFGTLTEAGGRIVQHVEITGPDGAPVEALYYMEHEADGTWRIDGCVLATPPETGA